MASEALKSLQSEGYYLASSIIDSDLVNRLKKQLEACIESEAKSTGIAGQKDFGMLLAAPIYGGSFLELLDHSIFWQPAHDYLHETCIIHVYTSSSLAPGRTNYSTRIHRERSDEYPDIPDFLGVIILLDEFTEANGATWFLPASHKLKCAPDETFFYAHAKRLIAPAGSVYYFDWRLYHAGGANTTNSWRHALAMGLTPAYHKQKIDLPRAIPAEISAHLSDRAKQKLGFFSVPPVSLAEYYAPPEKRPYRQRPI